MRRNTLLGAMLLSTLATSAWLAVQDGGGDAAEPVAPSRPGGAAGRPVLPVRAAARPTAASWPVPPRPRASEPWPFDAAQAAAWMPPPPPPPPKPLPAAAVVAGPPPPPAPPVFPYRLVGRIVDGEVVNALLSSPSRTLGVRELDVIDGQWRVDAIDGNGLTLTWLPGGQSQTLIFRPS